MRYGARMKKPLAIAVLCAASSTACTADVSTATAPASSPGNDARILVFTRTAGFRHDAIPQAVSLLERLATRESLRSEHTEDATVFTPERLARYRAVVFASTTGDVLDGSQQRALEDYIRGGGGFVGVHAAADTEYDWPWYGGLVGAWFHSHPPGLQTTQVSFEDRPAPSWTVTDEIYNYRDNPRERVRVLATVDERDYDGGTMGADHPIAWCHAYDGGRSWYTGLGHDAAIYGDPVFQAHLARGLRYAAGLDEDC